MSKCERCKKDADFLSMSFLNTQMICDECEDRELKHPRYEEARAVELAECRRGNYNFKGILG